VFKPGRAKEGNRKKEKTLSHFGKKKNRRVERKGQWFNPLKVNGEKESGRGGITNMKERIFFVCGVLIGEIAKE